MKRIWGLLESLHVAGFIEIHAAGNIHLWHKTTEFAYQSECGKTEGFLTQVKLGLVSKHWIEERPAPWTINPEQQERYPSGQIRNPYCKECEEADKQSIRASDFDPQTLI